MDFHPVIRVCHEVIGNRTPSQFMRHLKTISKGEVPEIIIKCRWISQLPKIAQAVLATMEDKNLEELAKAADAIVEVVTLSPKQQDNLLSEQFVDVVCVELGKMSIALDRLEGRGLNDLKKSRVNDGQRRGRSRGRSKSRGRSVSRQRRSKSRGNSRETRSRGRKLCWYHLNFGRNAHHCYSPCCYRY